jgi:hypothetical protein
MVAAWHGHTIICVNQTGKTQSNPSGTWHGMFELALTVLMYVNSDGRNKQVPDVVRKLSELCCFKDTKMLPLKYYASKRCG